MIKRTFHINVNCSNFERSLEFYKLLGFRVVVDIPEGDESESVKALGFDQGNFRAAIMQIGDDPRGTRLGGAAFSTQALGATKIADADRASLENRD